MRQYQELPVPTDTEPDQPNSTNEIPKIREEESWNGDCKTTEKEKDPGAFYLGPLRSSEASGYCSPSEEGGSYEFKNSRAFGKATPKPSTGNEEEVFEYTELLTVV